MQVWLAVLTIYVVVKMGFATGFAMVELFNPVEGVHRYVTPGGEVGVPPSVTLFPGQMLELFPELVGTRGVGLMVTVS